MVVSINQPAYLPWLGYFERIKNSDIFVYFDTVQFEKNSFTNRNKIKTLQGSKWLTVPVNTSGFFNKNVLVKTHIADDKWRKSHWSQIIQNYRTAPYWDMFSKEIGEIYSHPYSFLSELCWSQLVLFLDILKIETKIIKASQLPNFESKNDSLVLDILKHLDASEYISGALGRGYLDERKFKSLNIKLTYQDYRPKEYRQLWGKFIPNMGVIDLLFNEGENSYKFI